MDREPRLRLRNEEGTPVDPVPFLVVSLIGVAVGYSYGPIYLMALGLSLVPALGVCTVGVVVTVGIAYHRYVRTARPELRGEVPVDRRLKRLIYAVFIGIAALVLLSLPLLIR